MGRKEPGPIVLQGAAGPEVEVDGRRLIFLGGTNYLGLNTHPEVLDTLKRGLDRWGISSSGSRVTSGTAAAHVELEERLARLLGAGAAILCGSAYMGNPLLLEAFRGCHDLCLVDELCHPSLRDAIELGKLPAVRFRHRDAEHLRELLREHGSGARRPLIASEGVFATDGALAPLDLYGDLAGEFGATVLVDDAHGFGVLGESGSGTPAHLGLSRERLLQSATFSKALGGFGGFVAGPGELRERVTTSGIHVGATPLPPALAAAALRALELACEEDTLRRRLAGNTSRVKDGLRALGLRFPESPMPIARFVAGDAARNERVHAELRARGVLVPFIHYPGGPPGGFFRLVVTAAHTAEHISRALDVLRRVF